MKHAEKLIQRILFLEGAPNVSTLNKIAIGSSVEKQLRNDLESESGAIRMYNRAIKLSQEQEDNGTRELLDSILKDEEEHLDWLEAQVEQIDTMGIQIYLAEHL